MPRLSVRHLGKSFTLHQRGCRLQAFADLSFDCEPGRVTALVGPSGAGKSSVLKCIHRSYLPDSGAVLFQHDDGRQLDLASCAEHEVLQLRQRQLGFVTQFLHCLPRRSAEEVVAEPLRLVGESHAQALERARSLLQALAIPEALWRLPPATFSGGEQQRVNIARGFARPNQLLLLDEPTASLDAASIERVLELIRSARAAGCAILGIWHDQQLVERIADQVVCLSTPANSVEPLVCPSV